MRDFPPDITAFTAGSAQQPDTRSPGRLLWWLVRQQRDLMIVGSLCSVAWLLPATLTPFIFGQAIDQGIVAGDTGQIVFWTSMLLAVTLVGAGSGVFYHTVVVRSWLVALYGTTRLVTNKGLQLGHVLTRRSPTGEVLSVSGSDGDQFGGFMEIFSRAVGNLVAYVVVAVIVLQISLPLGLIVLLVAPLLVISSMPLLRPMGRAQTRERSRDSELTSRATDIVAGLRVLRGIGGERIFGDNYATQSQRVRTAGVQSGRWQALVEAVGVLFSGLFVVVLMYLGVREVQAGDLQIGELVTFLGYALFLVQPIRVFFEVAQKATRAVVSARKAIAVLSQPDPWPQDRQRPLSADAELWDSTSGLRVSPGLLTMVVSALPDESAALADRLGRYLPTDAEPTSLDPGEEHSGRAAKKAMRAAQAELDRRLSRDATRAREPWGVTLGGVDLADAAIEDVRATILVNDTASQAFAGTLQRAIDPLGRLTRQQAEEAMYAAAAQDVYDILPGGWQGELDERGRGLSGGQRQRLVLARALAADPRSWCWSSRRVLSTRTLRRRSPDGCPTPVRGRRPS